MNQLNREIKIEKFEAFYQWLKADGLAPRKSERLHKKRIFQNLLNNQEMTIENFKDFLEEEEKKNEKEIFDSKEFEGKNIKTNYGLLNIYAVYQIEEGIRVSLNDGGFIIVPNIKTLREIVL